MLTNAWRLSERMLAFRPARFIASACGMGFLFFLSSAQVGLLVGWVHTVTAIISHAGGDVWVMADQTPSFDYGTAIPERRLYETRSSSLTEWAEPVFMGWLFLQRPDGRRANIELVGIGDACRGGPWEMAKGRVACVHEPNALIVDELYQAQLGVADIGQELEVAGRRAVVRGICRNVRTLTAAPFCFCSVEEGRRFDVRYRGDEITYVVAKAREGVAPETLRDDLRRRLSHVDVVTTSEFSFRCARYWMLETGIGITVVLTAILGFSVGALVTSQTLFGVTNDHLPNFATLRAVGFSQTRLVGIVLIQSVTLGTLGTFIGSLLFFAAAHASARTPIPLETTPLIFSCLVAANLLVCLASSFLAVRTVLRVDPVSVFGGQG